MLAELVDHVIGVDPDRDRSTVAAPDSRTSGVITTDRFPATRDGYRDAIAWADAHTIESERAWVRGHRQLRPRTHNGTTRSR
jgi:transposase